MKNDLIERLTDLHQRILNNNWATDPNELDPIDDSHLCLEAITLLKHYREGLEFFENYGQPEVEEYAHKTLEEPK